MHPFQWNLFIAHVTRVWSLQPQGKQPSLPHVHKTTLAWQRLDRCPRELENPNSLTACGSNVLNVDMTEMAKQMPHRCHHFVAKKASKQVASWPRASKALHIPTPGITSPRVPTKNLTTSPLRHQLQQNPTSKVPVPPVSISADFRQATPTLSISPWKKESESHRIEPGAMLRTLHWVLRANS